MTDLRGTSNPHSRRRTITFEEGKKAAANTRCCQYIETSSLHGEGIDGIFELAVSSTSNVLLVVLGIIFLFHILFSILFWHKTLALYQTQSYWQTNPSCPLSLRAFQLRPQMSNFYWQWMFNYWAILCQTNDIWQILGLSHHRHGNKFSDFRIKGSN